MFEKVQILQQPSVCEGGHSVLTRLDKNAKALDEESPAHPKHWIQNPQTIHCPFKYSISNLGGAGSGHLMMNGGGLKTIILKHYHCASFLPQEWRYIFMRF